MRSFVGGLLMVFLLLLSMMWISDGCDDCVGLGWFAIINGYWLILVFRLLRCLSCEFHLHLVDLLLARVTCIPKSSYLYLAT